MHSGLLVSSSSPCSTVVSLARGLFKMVLVMTAIRPHLCDHPALWQHKMHQAHHVHLLLQTWRQPFPHKAKSPWGKPGTGVLTAADVATHLSITSVKAFWILLNQRDKDRVQQQPRGPLPSYGYNHSPTKIQPHLYGQNRALSHMLQIVLVVRTQNKKAEMGRENSSGVFSVI